MLMLDKISLFSFRWMRTSKPVTDIWARKLALSTFFILFIHSFTSVKRIAPEIAVKVARENEVW